MSENQKVSAVIDGFYFDQEQDIERARRETEGIAYIKANTDMENPETVLQLYQKLIEEQLFETMVGFAFLKELRDYLMEIPTIEEHELPSICVRRKEKLPENKSAEREWKTKKCASDQIGRRLKISLLVNLFLVILAAGMFIISMSGDNLNILNYENEIINRYADWEQELKQREQSIKIREQELGIMP